MSEVDGWDWVYAQKKYKQKKLSSVCFTGFSQPEKQSLSILAVQSNLKVVNSVNKSLTFLCTGNNPGKAKLVKAKENNIEVINYLEFIDFLKNGELLID